jgi:hypothetical protein
MVPSFGPAIFTVNKRTLISSSRLPSPPRRVTLHGVGRCRSSPSILELVTATGDVVNLSRDGDRKTLQGAVVGLGAPGVITTLTLTFSQRFKLTQEKQC